MRILRKQLDVNYQKKQVTMLKHDSVQDIRQIEIVAVDELKHMIMDGKVENAGTLIGYLLCCCQL